MARYSTEDTRSRIAKFPTLELMLRPNPQREMERLTAEALRLRELQ